MVISKFKCELNGDISEILLNTGEVMQNIEYLTDLEEKTITENGTYTPSTGKVGFSSVTVNVPSSGATKLYAWKHSSSIIYSFDEPSINGATVAVYVPSATVLTKSSGTYKSSATAITYDSNDYARYATGDISF